MATEIAKSVETKRRYVVAIDFGTHGSGFAYADTSAVRVEIMSDTNLQSTGGQKSLKGPTCILFREGPGKDELIFDSFGYEATDKYRRQLTDAERKSYHYFDLFKMYLYERAPKKGTKDAKDATGQKPAVKTTIQDATRREYPATTVFAEALKYFKTIAMKLLDRQNGFPVLPSDILWVVTVPAIWQDGAKAFMRSAAKVAGLFGADERQLMLALEPEAAAIYCQNERTNSSKVELKLADGKHVVVDCGGGTVDVTVHETKDGSMSEIIPPFGGALGSTYIDKNFRALLDGVFGAEVMNHFIETAPAKWLEMNCSFEICKHSSMSRERYFVPLPHAFIKFVGDPAKVNHAANFAAIVAKVGKEKLWYDDDAESLVLPVKTMHSLIQPVIDSIIKLLQSKAEIRYCDVLYLVGGFAANELLKQGIEDAFKDVKTLKIVCPSNPSLAVMSGAVRFGMNPAVVSHRIMPRHYGMDTLCWWSPEREKDGKQKISCTKNGVVSEYCAGGFNPIVAKNKPIEVGYTWKMFGSTATDDQTALGTTIFSSTSDSVPVYVDECERHASAAVTVPKGCPKGVWFTVKFGGTEMELTVTDNETNAIDQCRVEFFPTYVD